MTEQCLKSSTPSPPKKTPQTVNPRSNSELFVFKPCPFSKSKYFNHRFANNNWDIAWHNKEYNTVGLRLYLYIYRGTQSRAKRFVWVVLYRDMKGLSTLKHGLSQLTLGSWIIPLDPRMANGEAMRIFNHFSFHGTPTLGDH